MYKVIFNYYNMYATCIQPVSVLNMYWSKVGMYTEWYMWQSSHIIQNLPLPTILVTKPFVIGLVELVPLSRAFLQAMNVAHLFMRSAHNTMGTRGTLE